MKMRKVIGIPLFMYLAFAAYYYNVGINPAQEAPARRDAKDAAIQIYVHKYRHIAVLEMQRAGVPASITLAQGILESKHGTSDLATKANNHFGIKSGDHCTGRSFCTNTNEWNPTSRKMETTQACFCIYTSAEEGYRQHSEFLKLRPRYTSLFQLGKSNYKGWAKGLQQAGYATDPDYAQKLIGLIERYQLFRFDQEFQTVDAFRYSPLGL